MSSGRTWCLWTGPAAAIAVAVWLASTAHDGESAAGGKAPDSRGKAQRDRPAVSSSMSRAAELKEIHRLLASASPVASDELRNEGVIELLHRLAEHDPAAAIEFAYQNPGLHGQADLAGDLFGGWLQGDEEAAREWLGGIPAGDLRVQVVPILVAHWASDQPEEALALAGELPGYDGALEPLRSFGKWDHGDEIEGRVRERAYAGIFGEWAASDPAAAAARATTLEDPLLRNLAMQEVAAKWILKDSAAVVEWMKELPAGLVRNSALQGLVPEWTSQEPLAAAAFLVTLAESPERNEWLRMLGENWSSSDPGSALAWAARLPGEGERNLVVQTVLAKVAESGGRDAADFVLTLAPGSARTQGMELVLARWSANDPVAVSDWVNALPREAQRAEARAVLSAE